MTRQDVRVDSTATERAHPDRQRLFYTEEQLHLGSFC